jgi:hypothetical protein
VLTNPSGFTGIDGLFRFRAHDSNERGLAVLRVRASGGRKSLRRCTRVLAAKHKLAY